MSDSHESADVTGPDTPPNTPAQNDAPQEQKIPTTAEPTPVVEPAADAPAQNDAPQEQKIPTTAEPTPVVEPAADAPAQNDAPQEQQIPTPAEPTPVVEPATDAPAQSIEAEPATESEPQPTPEAPIAPSEETSSPDGESQGETKPEAQPETTPEAKPAAKPASNAKANKQKSGGQKSGRQQHQCQNRSRAADPATPRRRPGKPPKGPSVVVRYGIMAHIGQFRHNLDPVPQRGINVVIRTERGVELGEVLTVVDENACCGGCISPDRLQSHISANGPDYPFRRDGKILRLANPQDLIDQRHLLASAGDERRFCSQEIKDMKLDMKLVAVEHLLGGERIIFYFLAEHRVDFRDLVHKLANQYHTRIEMRQVGARDEARLVGDYERCGQECCCKQFLKGLQPVSMRMAKTQKATLDPSKISGRCGRLMCCLRYEDDTYRELKKQLPHKNIWVKTADQIGRVTGTQILTQLVLVQLPDGTRGVFANEDIIERNVDAPTPPTAATPRPTRAERKPERKSDRKPERKPEPNRTQQSGEQETKQSKRPPRKPKPQQNQPAAPKRELEPRATAEKLDPAWGALLGDKVSENPENDVKNAEKAPESTKTSQNPPKTPDSQTQAPGEQNAKPTQQTGEPRKKRRRRRGRRSKGKPSGDK